MFNIEKLKKEKMFLLFLLFSLSLVYFINENNQLNINKIENKDEIISKDLSEKDDIEIEGTELDFSSDIPVVVIDTKGQVINGDSRISATLEIYDSDKMQEDSVINSLNDKPDFVSDISIKIRGNTTRLFPKKQYGFKILDEEGNESNKKVLGMEKESDWILNAPFEDKSCIREPLAYHCSRKIMEYAPDTRYCEVFIVNDGADSIDEVHYKGLYIMIENIKRGKNRVDIAKNVSTDEDISFIVAKNPNKVDDSILYNYGAETYIYDYNLILEYPKKKLTKSQKNDINKHLSEFERVLYSDKYDIPEEGYHTFINIDSFVNYYIINEFFRNTDAGVLSTYLHKSYGEKIKAGPVWDFNTSMGNGDAVSPYNDYTGFYMSEKDWFDRLLSDINFVTRVVTRYNALRNTFLSEEYLLDYIDKQSDYIKEAANRNFEKWPISIINQSDLFKEEGSELINMFGENMILVEKYLSESENENKLKDDSDRSKTYKEELDMLKVFIINRGNWLDENIDSLYKWVD